MGMPYGQPCTTPTAGQVRYATNELHRLPNGILFCLHSLQHSLQLPRTTAVPNAELRPQTPRQPDLRTFRWRENRNKKQVRITLNAFTGHEPACGRFRICFSVYILFFISICSSSLMRPVYRVCMYSTPGFPILTIKYLLLPSLVTSKNLFRLSSARKKRFMSRVSSKRPLLKIRIWLKPLGAIGLPSLRLYNLSQDSRPPPSCWLKKMQFLFSCSVMSPILGHTLEFLCFPCHRPLSVSKRGWR